MTHHTLSYLLPDIQSSSFNSAFLISLDCPLTSPHTATAPGWAQAFISSLDGYTFFLRGPGDSKLPL